MSQSFHSQTFTQEKEKHMFTQKLVHKCSQKFYLQQPKLEATQLSIDRQIDKLWYVQTMKYYLAVKRNGLLIHTMTWMSLRIMKLRESNQIKGSTYCLFLYTYNSRKGKLMCSDQICLRDSRTMEKKKHGGELLKC